MAYAVEILVYGVVLLLVYAVVSQTDDAVSQEKECVGAKSRAPASLQFNGVPRVETCFVSVVVTLRVSN